MKSIMPADLEPDISLDLTPLPLRLVCLKLDNSEGDNVYFLMKQVRHKSSYF